MARMAGLSPYRKILLMSAMAALTATAAVACGSPPVASGTVTPASTAAISSDSAESGAGAAPIEPTQAAQPTWSERFTFSDGLAIEVAKPVAYRASAQAAGNTRGRAIKVVTTVINGSTQPYDFNPFTMGPDATQGGEKASQIFDFGNGAADASGTTILPGKKFTYTILLSVGKATDDLQLEYTESYGTPHAIFVGKA